MADPEKVFISDNNYSTEEKSKMEKILEKAKPDEVDNDTKNALADAKTYILTEVRKTNEQLLDSLPPEVKKKIIEKALGLKDSAKPELEKYMKKVGKTNFDDMATKDIVACLQAIAVSCCQKLGILKDGIIDWAGDYGVDGIWGPNTTFAMNGIFENHFKAESDNFNGLVSDGPTDGSNTLIGILLGETILPSTMTTVVDTDNGIGDNVTEKNATVEKMVSATSVEEFVKNTNGLLQIDTKQNKGTFDANGNMVTDGLGNPALNATKATIGKTEIWYNTVKGADTHYSLTTAKGEAITIKNGTTYVNTVRNCKYGNSNELPIQVEDEGKYFILGPDGQQKGFQGTNLFSDVSRDDEDDDNDYTFRIDGKIHYRPNYEQFVSNSGGSMKLSGTYGTYNVADGSMMKDAFDNTIASINNKSVLDTDFTLGNKMSFIRNTCNAGNATGTYTFYTLMTVDGQGIQINDNGKQVNRFYNITQIRPDYIYLQPEKDGNVYIFGADGKQILNGKTIKSDEVKRDQAKKQRDIIIGEEIYDFTTKKLVKLPDNTADEEKTNNDAISEVNANLESFIENTGGLLKIDTTHKATIENGKMITDGFGNKIAQEEKVYINGIEIIVNKTETGYTFTVSSGEGIQINYNNNLLNEVWGNSRTGGKNNHIIILPTGDGKGFILGPDGNPISVNDQVILENIDMNEKGQIHINGKVYDTETRKLEGTFIVGDNHLTNEKIAERLGKSEGQKEILLQKLLNQTAFTNKRDAKMCRSYIIHAMTKKGVRFDLTSLENTKKQLNGLLMNKDLYTSFGEGKASNPKDLTAKADTDIEVSTKNPADNKTGKAIVDKRIESTFVKQPNSPTGSDVTPIDSNKTTPAPSDSESTEEEDKQEPVSF